MRREHYCSSFLALGVLLALWKSFALRTKWKTKRLCGARTFSPNASLCERSAPRLSAAEQQRRRVVKTIVRVREFIAMILNNETFASQPQTIALNARACAKHPPRSACKVLAFELCVVPSRARDQQTHHARIRAPSRNVNEVKNLRGGARIHDATCNQ